MVFCARDFSLTVRAFWRAEQLRWVETNFEEMRKVDQCSGEMKTVEKNLLRWNVRRDGMRWEELRWGEKSSHDLRWDEVSNVKCKCEVRCAGCETCTVKCEESAPLALHCTGVAQVMFLDNISATASHKARTHGRGWGTAHASSIDDKGFIAYPQGNFCPASWGHYWYMGCLC